MKRIEIRVIISDDTATVSELTFGDKVRVVLERPWIPDAPGGRPSESCIPAGRYRIRKHERPNGDVVLALDNPGLGVFYLSSDRPNGVGRFLILVHPANYPEQIEGCIAPGFKHLVRAGGHMVTHSRQTMRELMDYIGDDEAFVEIFRNNDYREATT